MSSELRSKPQRAYEFLRARIERGGFEPGERLLAGQVAAELGFSVVPVREAIQRLAAEGFITIEHNVGPRLATFDARAYREGMESLAIIDGIATALAAPEIGSEDLLRARELNARLAELLEHFDAAEYGVLNSAFHESLHSHCPNRRILELVGTEWARFGNLRDPSQILSVDRARASVAEHERMVRLIEQGADPREIETAAREHVLSTLRAQFPGAAYGRPR